jgi:hypothetical protein
METLAFVMALLPLFKGWSSTWTMRLQNAGRLRQARRLIIYALLRRAAKHRFSGLPEIFS